MGIRDRLKTISRFFYKIIFKPEFIITVKTDRTPIPLTFSFVKSRNISATVPAKYRMIPDKTPLLPEWFPYYYIAAVSYTHLETPQY